jgi:probable F420-dependent oxidoreductase
MLIGFNLPMSGPLSSPDTIARLAVEGEAIGYDYAAVSDHLVEPIDIHARYPYSESGEFPRGSRGDRHEQLTAIAYLAAKTSRLRFLTSVMVVPHRPAVLTAKILSTIDVLSAGRLFVGIGAGWLEEEFEAIGAPNFAERGIATDEYLQAFRDLWTTAEPRFEGRFVKFAGILFAPKPIQKPHPPIWVGGESGAAMRRAARLGDGWYPIGSNPQYRLNTLSRYRVAIATVPWSMPRLTTMRGNFFREPTRTSPRICGCCVNLAWPPLTSVFPAQLTRSSSPPCGSFTTKWWPNTASTYLSGAEYARRRLRRQTMNVAADGLRVIRLQARHDKKSHFQGRID